MKKIPLLTDLGAVDEARERPRSVFAVLRTRKQGTTKAGDPFWTLTLADAEHAVEAKVWKNAEQAFAAVAEADTGQVVKVAFRTEEYKGRVQLKISELRTAREDDPGYERTRLFGDAPAWVEKLACRTLVFDIETVPATDIRDMPPTIVKTLAEHSERNDRDQSLLMSLSPYFGKVVSLAFGEGEGPLEDQEAKVLVVPPPSSRGADYPDWILPVSEPELLQAFWGLAAHAETVVSYNGRGFDLPFLVARSLIHKVPVRTDLLSDRWGIRPHLDLFDILGQRGRGPANLDVVCWALDIMSPKGEMDGSMVAPAYERGEVEQIATYNREDIRATTAVYQQTRDYLLRFRRDW